MIDNRALLFAIAACPVVRHPGETPVTTGEPDHESLVNGRLVKAARRSNATATTTRADDDGESGQNGRKCD